LQSLHEGEGKAKWVADRDNDCVSVVCCSETYNCAVFNAIDTRTMDVWLASCCNEPQLVELCNLSRTII
jgi:hypothetical protein